MNKLTKLLGATAAATLVAISGTAFTAANNLSGAANVAGYGTSTVTGATVNTIEHSVNADGTGITRTKLVFAATQEANTVKAGFDGTLVSCTVGATPFTTVTCDYATAVATSGATKFEVSVVSKTTV